MNSEGRRESDKGALLWKIAGAGFGIVFTVLFSRFVDSYSSQAESLANIESQMTMADFPSLRVDVEKLELQVKSLESSLADVKNEIAKIKG